MVCTLTLNRLFGRLNPALGMTETSTGISMMTPTQKVGTLGSAGQLLSGVRARVIKPDGTLAGVGEPGELMVTGPSVALRYLNNEKA
jgi:4-coumarate--CoA ligase